MTSFEAHKEQDENEMKLQRLHVIYITLNVNKTIPGGVMNRREIYLDRLHPPPKNCRRNYVRRRT